MKKTNRQSLSRASRKATSVAGFIQRLTPNLIITDYYFEIIRAGSGVSIKALLKNTDRSDESMTVVEYRYPIIVLRYNKPSAVLIKAV